MEALFPNDQKALILECCMSSTTDIIFQNPRTNKEESSDDDEPLPLRSVDKDTKFREETVSEMDDLEFARHFRMQKNTFDELHKVLAPNLPEPYIGFGKRVINSKERLYIVIWYLASNETNRALAARFGVAEGVVHESVDMVISTMNRMLDNIHFPETVNQCEQMAAKFGVRNGFPGIVGAIDGTHIEIAKFKDEPDAWIDRKGRRSINVLAVCDAYGRYIFTSIGCPGSFHDSRVFRMSQLPELLTKLPTGYHIVGDSAYQLQDQLLTPYRDTGNLTGGEKLYNYMHSANRMIIENAFGLLKNKFPRVHNKLNVKSLPKAICIIEASLRLSNFILNLERPVHEEFEPMTDPIFSCNPNMKRNEIRSRLETE